MRIGSVATLILSIYWVVRDEVWIIHIRQVARKPHGEGIDPVVAVASCGCARYKQTRPHDSRGRLCVFIQV